MSVSLNRAILLCLAVSVLASNQSWAQTAGLTDHKGTVEAGVFHEWFHRQLEPSIYDDTRWNIVSGALKYSATDWMTVGFEGGYSNYTSEDFPGSEFQRFVVGVSGGVRAYHRENWDVSVSGRYADTFDLDSGSQFFHKRIRSISGSVDVVGRLALVKRAVTIWAGPYVVDDLVQSFLLDSLEPIESTSGAALGGNAGMRVIVANWIAVYGFASYVDEVQGGVGICFHAGSGGL
jgi:hypothetical protein